jgi:glycosyltransferase involved in cell wall biosynthesis
MKIVEVLTYYRPHVSGLTIYVERLSKALAVMGHEVTVFTSRYDRDLPLHESKDGVTVHRIPVAFRVSKGVIMPTFGVRAWGMVRGADVVHLHLPQFDAPGLAVRGRLFRKPVVLTYHSDLQLPPGPFNRAVDQVVKVMNRLAGYLSDAIVTYTHDFGTHSPYLSRYAAEKLVVIPPPVELVPASTEQVHEFGLPHAVGQRPVIGIAGRLAAEKGIEVLLDALPGILDRFPDVLVLHAGPTEAVIGEEAYAARLAPRFEQYREHYKMLGNLEGSELTAFYQSLDCLVLCSLNNTETFGLVQIEAMINDVPAVVSDLPGVRQPVAMTGMGEIVPVGDHSALAQAVVRVLANKAAYQRPPQAIRDTFSPVLTAQAYVELFEGLLAGEAVPGFEEPEAYERLRAVRAAADAN